MNMKSSRLAVMHDLKRQLDAAPWLKWALLAIALLGAVFVGQALESVREGAQKRAIDAEVSLRRIRALQGQDVWTARAEQSDALLAALRAEVPAAATPGMAQAAVQSWLNELANNSGMQNARIAVENAVVLETPPGLLKVRGTLSGGALPRQAMNIIRQIESSTNLVSIETIELRNDGNRILSISLNAYYRQPEQEVTP